MSEIVLEDSVLEHLASRPEVLREFPELQIVRASPASCCGRPSSSSKLESLKLSLAALSQPRQERLKYFLGATGVRVYYLEAGQLKSRTF